MSAGFVGRPAELEVLRTRAAEAAAGEPQLIFVEGGPGIGKTSLTATFGATLRGWRWLTVAGYQDEKKLPLELLSRLIDASGHGSTGRRQVAPSGDDPFVAGAALVQILGDLEQDGPVAVVVDDAPWSDPQSLRALIFALRRLQTERILIVLTMRTQDISGLPPALLHYGQNHATFIRLAGLDSADICELFRLQGLGTLSSRAATRLREHTAGNPLHLRALFQELPLEELRRTRGPLPAPSSVAGLVLAALAECRQSTRRLLMSAAVLGPRCALAEAAAVSEVPEPLDRLEEATGTGLVEAVDEGDGWLVAFRHPLFRSAIYDDLGPATRRRLHARAATVQQDRALTHRAAAAGDQADPELVLELVADARRQEATGRQSTSADLLMAAARLCPPGASRDGIFLDAIDRLLRAGELAEAAAFADRLATLPTTAQLSLVRARWAAMEGRHNDVDDLARSVWSTGDDAQRSSAAALLAQLSILRDDNDGAAQWAERALRAGTLSAQVTDEAQATRAMALALSGQVVAGLDTLDDAAVDASAELRATRGILRMISGDNAGALRDLQICLPGQPGWNTGPRVVSGLAVLADVEFRIGAWDDARRHADQAISLVTDTDQSWLLAFVHAMAVFVPAAQGAWEEAERHCAAALAAAAGLPDRSSTATAANSAVYLAACRGDPAAVVTAAEPLVRAGQGASREPGVMGWAGHYMSALVALGRFDEAETALAEFDAVARQLRRPSAAAVIARVRGELALARRDHRQARDAFERAVTIGAGSATVLDQALAQTLYGGLLRRSGERRAAADLLRVARDSLIRLGAIPLLDRCNGELVRCGLAVDRPTARPTSLLTPQERAVARLVCAGHTNRQVAAELVISVKTVGYHLGNTYAKLGVNTRTQLAAVLGQSGSAVADPGKT